jgi:hypothetical protein
MATFLGELIIKITGQNAQLDQSIDQSEKKVISFDKKLKALGEKAKSIGKKMTIGLTLPILAIGTAFAKTAIDAEETASKFATVFKDVSKESQKAAKNLSDNFGLSTTKSKELLSATGDLLTGFGFTGESALDLSTKVNELAVDLASFTNFSGGAEGASAALTKALLGERESVKSLGISILETDVQAKVFQLTQEGIFFETERQAKAYATLLIAQEQSKNAIGDYARTQDSAANQIRQLKSDIEDLAVEFGKELIPIVKSGIKFVRDVVKWFNSFDDSTKRLILILGGLVAAIGPVLSILGTLSAIMATNPFLLVIAGIGALTAGVIAFVSSSDDMNKNMEDQKERLDELTGSAGEYRTELERINDLQKRSQEVADEFDEKIVKLKKSLDALTKAQQRYEKIPFKESYDERRKRLDGLAAINKSIEQIEIQIAENRRVRDREAGKVAKINEDRAKEVRKVRLEEEAVINEAIADFRFERLKGIDREIAAIRREAAEAIEAGVDKVEVNTWAEEEIDRIKQKYDEEESERRRKNAEGIKTTTAELIELEQQGFSFRLERLQEQEEAEAEAAEKIQEYWKEAYNNILGFADDSINKIIGIGDQYRENEEIRLENLYKKQKENIEKTILDEEAKTIALEELEQRFDIERSTLKRKQAEADKAAGAFNATIQGIQAVTQTFAAFGWPAGIIPAGIMAGISAAQVAAILAKPIPALATGGLIMPTAGGAIVKMAEAGVPEYAVPETTDVMTRLADRISANMSRPNVTNNTTNNNMTPNMTLNIDGQDFFGFLTKASRDGKFFVDPHRGVSRR